MNINQKNKFDKNIIILIFIFIISRYFYYSFFDIKFDYWTIGVYWQFIPKDLLRDDLLNSILYNHYQPPLLNLVVGLLMKVTENYIKILQLIYLVCGLLSFVFIYLICKDFKFSKRISMFVSIILMVLPTSILYENHLYKEYLTFFFLLAVFYSSNKLYNNFNSYKYILYFSLTLSLLCLTRETFHIFWGYVFIFFIQKNLSNSKKILLILIFTTIVSPFYFKNLFIFNKFAISAASTYEHLNQKIDFIKEMKNPNNHAKLRQFTFGDFENFKKFKNKGSLLFDTPLYSGADYYKSILNYKNKSKIKILNSSTLFNEVYFEVEKFRKQDYLLILKEQPGLLMLNFLNSATRHLFSSSDYFGFTKHNADRMKYMIKFVDCLKLTPICFYEYGFTKKTSFIGGNSYESIDTGPLNYKEKIIFAFQHTNFLLLIVYLSLLFFLFKGIFVKKNISLINFWLLTFFFIFLILIIFEDGEISRHRFPFDYLSFLIFLSIIKKKFERKLN